jgi:hypothetical protein
MGLTKDRRGAEVKVRFLDGRIVRGELITVKPDSLLILDKYTGMDTSVELENIREVLIVKKSKFLKGAGLGLLIGSAGGGLLGYALGDDPDPSPPEDFFSFPFSFSFSAEEKALGLGIFFGLISMIAGGFAGAGAGTDQPIMLYDSSRLLLELNLEKLRRQSRIPDYR